MNIQVRCWHKKMEEYVQPSRFLVIDSEGILVNDDCIIEQFTGLTDKNGVNIFEGDVVKIRGGRKPKNQQRGFYTSTVIFDKGLFRPKVNKTLFHDHAALVNCEVIGNVHKNPEPLS